MRSEQALRLLCAAALAAAASACNVNPATPASAGVAASGTTAGDSLAMLRTELYFEAVALADWEGFLAVEVTPRFPDGLSWWDIHGQWRAPSGQPEKMPSRLMVLVHADNARNETALRDIAAGFHARFGTHVLVVSQAVQARDADWTEARLQGHPQLGADPAG
jgi:hypothetical protein